MALRNYTKEGEKNFILIVCVLFLILSFFVIKGILAVIIFSFILAYFLYPLHNFYLRNINNDRISAMLATFYWNNCNFFTYCSFKLFSYIKYD